MTFAQIETIQPGLHSHTVLYMLESFGATVQVSSEKLPDALVVQLWTNVINKLNSEGDWVAIDLKYESEIAPNFYQFTHAILPTSTGDFRFTYRVGLKENPQNWLWAGGFQENGNLRVEPPSDAMSWTQGASYVEFLPGVYVGNFIAASQAENLGFDAVLNLAAEFPLSFTPELNISYKHIRLLDGAVNVIPDEAIRESINWINLQLEVGRKVLINCRAGIGRSGSMSVAYCYYKNAAWDYEQTLDYMWEKKADIYPHRNLQASLERLFPR
jgi:protein-tyrosine phosphatase